MDGGVRVPVGVAVGVGVGSLSKSGSQHRPATLVDDVVGV